MCRCGDVVDQSGELALVMIVALCLLAFLSLLVALLRAMLLAKVMHLFAVLQRLAVVCVAGSRESPYYTQQLTTAATYFNLMNFDVSLPLSVR
jgi:hypothetical protein